MIPALVVREKSIRNAAEGSESTAQYNDRNIFRNDIYTQVVGHTSVGHIYKKDGVISTDVFSAYRDGIQIGESAMVVIDTQTGEYEKVNVSGADGAG